MSERLGYEVIALTDSTEALHLFRRDSLRFACVITDQDMLSSNRSLWSNQKGGQHWTSVTEDHLTPVMQEETREPA
jgi:hypothetical protein